MEKLDQYPQAMGKVAPRSLTLHGIKSPQQAAKHTEKELLAIHGVGPKAVRILKELLAQHGMSFRK